MAIAIGIIIIVAFAVSTYQERKENQEQAALTEEIMIETMKTLNEDNNGTTND